MDFFNEIAIFFQGTSLIVWLTLVLGFIFIVIEMFQPGFGIFGVVGAAIIALGTVLRCTKGDGNVLAQIFIIVFMESIAGLIAFIVLISTSKNGWLKRSPLVEKQERKEEIVND